MKDTLGRSSCIRTSSTQHAYTVGIWTGMNMRYWYPAGVRWVVTTFRANSTPANKHIMRVASCYYRVCIYTGRWSEEKHIK